MAFVLWVFAFLDAYFTALEINSGADAQVDVVNPRVAVVLNLLTAGLGYFYLGERAKGMVLFVVINALKWLTKATTGFWGGVIALFGITMASVMALDAYRLAREQIREAHGPEPEPQTRPIRKPSRLPMFVPVTLASLAVTGFLGMLIFGLAVVATRGPGHAVSRTVPGRPLPRALHRFAPGSVQAAKAAVVEEFLSAVQDIQRVQKKSDRGPDDLADLEHDAERITAALTSGRLDPSDLKVAYFYRGEAGCWVNWIRRHQGEEIDLALARHALEDFEHVITTTGSTYDPLVSIPNAQYWAGIVARNDLHSEADAYAYWDRCAQKGHAGCQNIVANARITGDGGHKVDLRQALDMHLAVFNTGTRARCAGANSARSIARINYFTGVRRPGDDELTWLQKAYELMDKVEAAEANKSACQRSAAEVEEFLYRLSHGDRRDRLLQEATERLDQNSIATRGLIQFLFGATDKTGFEALVESDHSEDERCSAYFDAMWYAELKKKRSEAEDFRQRMSEIGEFSCGTELAFAGKFKLGER